MATEYVAQILLEVNGQSLDDFASVTEGEYEVRKEVKLATKFGVITVPVRYPLEVEYNVPKDVPEFDFESVSNGTLTIDKLNGLRVMYSGVYCLKVGATKYDGDKEATRTLNLVAMKRKK